MDIIKTAVLAISLAVALPAFCAEKLNINTATAQQIATSMKGVGEQKAKLIVDYRSDHGPFINLEQLRMVKGIGTKTIEDNREFIIVK